MKRVIIPLPDRDFDVTEVSVPWRMLTRAGHRVTFATERGGAPPAADPLLLTGVIFGQLGADDEAKSFYRELEASPEFCAPIAWNDIDVAAFDGMLLPGGHAKGMRQYLEGEALRAKTLAFWQSGRVVGAICHGVVVLARTRDASGASVLAGMKTTCLPKYMERSAYMLTFWKLGKYYRTYPEYVEDEVRAALADPAAQFQRGPRTMTKRGTASDDAPAFVVEDGRYVSARWPGDAYLFAKRFIAKLEG
jgi:putative intracellular protease/amidase